MDHFEVIEEWIVARLQWGYSIPSIGSNSIVFSRSRIYIISAYNPIRLLCTGCAKSWASLRQCPTGVLILFSIPANVSARLPKRWGVARMVFLATSRTTHTPRGAP